ncbi:ParB/RepB/Spo0J family partition protein [Roseobacter litoralis]|uniref:ParB/RepB/Spo0J family partition protein n=1 Tax=Roseobacter litoralis TaxID=42443 RepID=UPI002491AB04|nr:ParB/RepB/Spo0J family partition protein [Roseobacter litoralis]
MTRSNTPQITFLPVSDIQVRDRLRDTSEAAVAALEASIPERGILSPLQVQLVKGTYYLMDGLHRLEGARRCGLDEVPVIIRNCSMREARNIEVDTALAAAPLDSLSMAVFLAAQKDLYEEEFPEAKAATGADLVARRWDTRPPQQACGCIAKP